MLIVGMLVEEMVVVEMLVVRIDIDIPRIVKKSMMVVVFMDEDVDEEGISRSTITSGNLG